MHKTLLILVLGACGFCSAAQADVLAMPAAAATSEADQAIAMPQKGQSMSEVLKKFGEPKIRHKPAGGDTPRHPAITRFDYADFSVFFERGKVIDSVNPRKPAALHHTNKLEPLDY
jgi:hypothetical protein